jgi:asparagine synthase (glutamine-hydrolysing)
MPHEGSAKTTVELHEALGSTVAMQLVSDVPLGVFLSGGVDSSAVAAVAAAAAPGSLHTFTIGFEEAAYDESRHARAVADAIGSRHTSVMLTEQSFQDQLPSALAAIDQPTFDGINTYFVSRAARDAGMTVALAGTGGDEIFGGYPSFVDIPRGLRAGTCLPAADGSSVTGRILDRAVGLADRVVHAWHWKVRGVASPQTRWAKWADAARAAHDEVGLYQVFYALFTGATQARLAGTQVAAAQRALDHGLSTGVARLWRERVAGAEPLHAVSLLELSSFVGERLLRDTDAASMAVSLEVRVPLLDHVLVETVAGVDPARRFMPPRAKQLLRDTGLRKLDPALFDRPKSGFVLPIDTWARRRLQPQMAAVFADAELARRVGLNAGVLGTLCRSFLEGRRGLYWSRVWALYVLLCWCRDQDVRLDG